MEKRLGERREVKGRKRRMKRGEKDRDEKGRIVTRRGGKKRKREDSTAKSE